MKTRLRLDNLSRREYDREADLKVKEELLLADIPVLPVIGVIEGEVKTHYIGVLNGFVFERAWTYWVVSGWMPMEHARYIYANYKDLDIRAGGHCGNESPEESYIYTNPAYIKRLEEFRDSCSSLNEFIDRAKEEVKENPDDSKFIKFYHVDTQLGLCKLAEVIKQFDIHTEYVE